MFALPLDKTLFTGDTNLSLSRCLGYSPKAGGVEAVDRLKRDEILRVAFQRPDLSERLAIVIECLR